MPETFAARAGRITCVACSIATSKVHIVSFEPFQVNPPNVLDTTFASQNIDGTQIDIFKKAAADVLPATQKGREDIAAKILAQAIDPQKPIMRFSNFLEALIAQQEM
jgi:hypothetical protein